MGTTISLVLMVVCAAVYFKAAQIDKAPRLLWPTLSILLWAGASFWLDWGIVGCLLSQVGLLAAITCWRLVVTKVKSRRRA